MDNGCSEVIEIHNKKYCILLNQEQTGKALVMLVYMDPVLVSASVAKQNASCIRNISFGANMGSTLAHAATTLSCTFCVESVLDLWWHMCPLSVGVEQGRWIFINIGVRPGMVASSSLWSSAPSSVADGVEHIHWLM